MTVNAHHQYYGEEKEEKKPPLGVLPRELWDVDRQLNLIAAMERYVGDFFKIPPEWIDELNDLNERDK